MTIATVGMSPLDLFDQLIALQRELTEDIVLDDGRHGAQGVQFWEDIIPPRTTDNSNTPFIYQYFHAGADDGESSTCTIGHCIGTYSPDLDGWRDAKHIAFRIREELLRRRQVGKYRLLLAGDHRLTWRCIEQLTVENRTYPLHYMELLSTWQIAGAAPLYDEGVEACL